MKRILLLASLLCSLSWTVGAQDFNKGYEAQKRGDFATAMRHYRPLAEQGNAAAQLNVGALFHNGQGVPQSYAEALKWYRKAAEQGHAIAQSNLGVMYDEGRGVPQDYTEAAQWFYRAAEQGNTTAQRRLGVRFEDGRGVPQNYSQAYIWYSLAAAGGEQGALNSRDSSAKRLTPEQLRDAQREATERWEHIRKRKK